jgi:hypothetical protein
MSHTPVKGSIINISLDDVKSSYIVSLIDHNIIYIHPISFPDINNAIVYVDGKWKVKNAEHVNYIIDFYPDKGEQRLYEWPTTSAEVVHPEKGSDFLKFARSREAKILQVSERYGGRFDSVSDVNITEYPGDEEFVHIPNKLIRHIAIHDAPIYGQESMTRPELLKAIWIQYGPILKHVNFFSKNPSREYLCIMGEKVPTLMGILPDWVKEIYQVSMDRFLKSEEIKCFSAATACLESVRVNRGFTEIQHPYEPMGRDILEVASEIEKDLHQDRAAIVIQFDIDSLGNHIMTIIRLRDPTKETPTYRDFACQAYIFQSTLLIEEIEDVPTYLKRINALPHIADENEFILEYERLFHATMTRLPKPEEWTEIPSARILNSK